MPMTLEWDWADMTGLGGSMGGMGAMGGVGGMGGMESDFAMNGVLNGITGDDKQQR
jgi:hypothetical protein